MALLLISAALTLTLASCAVRKAVTISQLPVERRTECEEACQKLNLEFAAMVLMMDSAGCVCQVADASGRVGKEGGSAGAGASTITAAQAAQAAAQAAQIAAQQQQRRQQNY